MNMIKSATRWPVVNLRRPLAVGPIAEAHDVVLVDHDRDFDDIATLATGLRTLCIVAPPAGAG